MRRRMSFTLPRRSSNADGGEDTSNALQIMAQNAELRRDKAEAEANLAHAESQLQVWVVLAQPVSTHLLRARGNTDMCSVACRWQLISASSSPNECRCWRRRTTNLERAC
eukprot:SAG31_NODE_3618_length_4063_cov_2.665237_2_plen_110_part_00